MNRAQIRRLLWIATAGYWVFLFIMTHLPPRKVPDIGVNDKIEHLGAYGLLAGGLFLSIWATSPRTFKATWLTPIIALAYGALDEITQAIPIVGRSCELNDWLADALGTIIAVAILTLIRWCLMRRKLRTRQKFMGAMP